MTAEQVAFGLWAMFTAAGVCLGLGLLALIGDLIARRRGG